MDINNSKEEFSLISSDGYKNGFSLNHYKKLKKILNNIDSLKVAEDRQFSDLYYRIDFVIKTLYQYGLLHSISKENIDYIHSNTFLLHLVLANNNYEGKIKLYSKNSYMFLCQFHLENTPSFGVTDFNNLAHCFGCGHSVNQISYLMEYENLSYKQAIQLLAQIYLYDIKSYDSNLDSLVKKYQEVIVSDVYKELLEQGKKRLEKRSVSTFDINSFYSKRYDVISRI